MQESSGLSPGVAIPETMANSLRLIPLGSTPGWCRGMGLFDSDVLVHRKFLELGEAFPHQRPELIGRERQGHAAIQGHHFAEFVTFRDFIDFLIEALDYERWCASRHKEARPQVQSRSPERRRPSSATPGMLDSVAAM